MKNTKRGNNPQPKPKTLQEQHQTSKPNYYEIAKGTKPINRPK